MHDVIIVGGGPAGLAAALYLLRANKTVLIIEKNAFGGQMTLSPKIENYPGFPSVSGMELADIMLEQVLEKGADVELDTVLSVDDGETKTVHCSFGDHSAKAVIIANGVKHRTLGIAKEADFVGKGVYYCAVCDGGYYKGKDVVLIGGGNSALQEAIMLSEICKSVTVVQNLESFTGEKKLVATLSGKPNVKAIFSSVVESIIDDNGVFGGINIVNTATNESQALKADAMFVAIGLVADNGKFANVARLNEFGYFDSAESCQSGTPGIFVAGDCRSKTTRQILTAMSDGASAAIAASAYTETID